MVWSLRGRTLWWHEGDVRAEDVCIGHPKLAQIVSNRRSGCPRPDRFAGSSQSQISKAEAKWIRGKAEEIWLVLIIDGIPGFNAARLAEPKQVNTVACLPQRQYLRRSALCCAGVGAVDLRPDGRSCSSLSTEEVVTPSRALNGLVAGHAGSVELRRESADIR